MKTGKMEKRYLTRVKGGNLKMTSWANQIVFGCFFCMEEVDAKRKEEKPEEEDQIIEALFTEQCHLFIKNIQKKSKKVK